MSEEDKKMEEVVQRITRLLSKQKNIDSRMKNIEKALKEKDEEKQ